MGPGGQPLPNTQAPSRNPSQRSKTSITKLPTKKKGEGWRTTKNLAKQFCPFHSLSGLPINVWKKKNIIQQLVPVLQPQKTAQVSGDFIFVTHLCHLSKHEKNSFRGAKKKWVAGTADLDAVPYPARNKLFRKKMFWARVTVRWTNMLYTFTYFYKFF